MDALGNAYISRSRTDRRDTHKQKRLIRENLKDKGGRTRELLNEMSAIICRELAIRKDDI